MLPKRRFSAFFKTDLDQTLRTWHVDTVAVGGITTHFCVLATAFDAICHDFRTVILEDLCASHKREIHENTLNAYRRSAIHPLLTVATSSEFLEEYRRTSAAGRRARRPDYRERSCRVDATIRSAFIAAAKTRQWAREKSVRTLA